MTPSVFGVTLEPTMNGLYPDVLHGIGNTPLLALRNVVPQNGCRLLLKLEGQNPTGSMKDRMALAMIEAAEADGRLRAGGSVVEYTAGSTGVSLSLICAVRDEVSQHRLVSRPHEVDCRA